MKLLLLLMALAYVAGKEGPLPNERRVVCYYTNWSGYRVKEVRFTPEKIDPFLCTHMLYAFAIIDTDQNVVATNDPYQDIQNQGMKKVTDLKEKNSNLKVMISIGGWNYGSAAFSNLTSDESKRQDFVSNTVQYLRKSNFDGIDICWQYPTFREGGRPEDRDNFSKLIKELKEAFDEEAKATGNARLQLSVVISGLSDYIEGGFDIPTVNRYVDFINLIAYDYHLSTGPSVNHHSALYATKEEESDPFTAQLNSDASVKKVISKGISRQKINLGIPTYGRLYQLEDSSETSPGSPAVGSGKGNTTTEVGYMPYFELCNSIKQGGWTVNHHDKTKMGPYAYKGTLWIGYDDEGSSRLKGDYARKNGLGGVMFWTIDDDDFLGRCSNRVYPLINSAKEALIQTSHVHSPNLN